MGFFWGGGGHNVRIVANWLSDKICILFCYKARSWRVQDLTQLLCTCDLWTISSARRFIILPPQSVSSHPFIMKRMGIRRESRNRRNRTIYKKSVTSTANKKLLIAYKMKSYCKQSCKILRWNMLVLLGVIFKNVWKSQILNNKIKTMCI